MTATPLDRGTFLVTSESGAEPYLVDLFYQEEPWNKPRPVCGCPDCFCKDFKPCKHMMFLVRHLNETTNTNTKNVSAPS